MEAGLWKDGEDGGAGIDWFDILKWVLIVLAAGFIGQFGKRLADFLVARARRRRAARASARSDSAPAEERVTIPSERSGATDEATKNTKKEAKIAKKAAKAEVKRAKKSVP